MNQPRPIVLQDAFKQFRHDQEKIQAPETTVAQFKEKLAASGLNLLEDIVRVDNGRLDIPVYFSICGSDARNAIGNYKQMGKGATPAQARASAVMELGERFSLYSFRADDTRFIDAPFNALESPTLPLEAIARSVNDASDDLAVALEVFKQLPLRWTWAFNLTRGESMLVPFNWFWAINEFNGASAGNCIEEALCQGICEVVERHVSALAGRPDAPLPAIDPASVNDPVARELLDKYRNAGVQVHLSDLSMEVGIPTVGALAWDPATFPDKSEVVWTAGTTTNPAKALCRTLTEVAQLAGDFNSGGNYVASGLPKFNHPEQARHVTHPQSRVPLDALPDVGDDNIKTEVLRCVAALARRRMEVLVVDVRHPRLDIPAFYTMVPGTRFRERAAGSSVGMVCAKLIAEQMPVSLAIAQLADLERRMPGKHYTPFYLGKLYLDQGAHPDALNHLHRAAEREQPAEDRASVFTYLGIAYKEMGQYGEALAALSQADAIDPERTDTLNLMGFCHFKKGAHEMAIACFERVVKLNPGSAIDYANLAVNHRAIGNIEQAKTYYRLALSLDPEIDFARQHLEQLES
ncbi:YcaO-like family protein [Desulfatitalea alkaliphila]|uniref:YcaO-like family protein n=1 Tax=Desulfatitalea alkaliphila TaxID=2929485 RepID=A0AA41R231_9BACT|nr:YcaO-like family protein [Desulfatitalea alkaliphila]MCJ8500604.1 YcaO-like family protein [Desulfatitalea alkaliphila]